ncbi:MAG: 23S rRNA (guanosine(2251)-2'-O)-methyltransferase RlmB, partial [Actinomycetaceae bacterium]|nr:23S rRNA (guanosine(2251)-2'-O)-methyltransferase RlmB [Actinomycetaceae bacterium]
MSGNPNAKRPASKKGPTRGSGGKRARGLRGKGPTPKAEDRTYHPAHARKLRREEAERQALARAAQSKAVRKELQLADGCELIVGRNPVFEAVKSGMIPSRVFVAGVSVSDERVEHVLRAATASGVPFVEVSRSELDRMSDGAVHQGIAIEVPPYSYGHLDDILASVQTQVADRDGATQNIPLFLALDSVTDPHNLGAALRSASAFGAHAVIVPERRSAPVNAAVWKVSAGAAARVPVVKVPNLVRALELLKKQGYFVVGLDGGGSEEIDTLSLADTPLVLVTGSEGKGLARLTRETCDVI